MWFFSRKTLVEVVCVTLLFPLLFAAYDDLILKGEDTAVNKAIEAINNGLGGDYVSIDEDGLVSINISDEQIESLNDEQKALYGVVNEAVEAGDDVTVNVVESSTKFGPGGFKSETIDIDDINEFGDGEVMSSTSVLAHELKEQNSKPLMARVC